MNRWFVIKERYWGIIVSAIVNIFDSAFTDEHRAIKVQSGLRIEEVENLDWENALIYVNGFERTKDYKVKENDVVTIRQFPSGSKTNTATALGWIFMPVTSAVHFFTSGSTEGALMWIGHGIDNYIKDMFKQPDQQDVGQGEQIPTISGAKNRSGAGQPIPLLLGQTMYTPITLAQSFTDINPSDGTDGENQYFHGLYCLGYNNIDLKSVSLGIYKLSIDEHNGTSGSLDCSNQGIQTITGDREVSFNTTLTPQGSRVLRIPIRFEGYETLSVNSITTQNVQAKKGFEIFGSKYESDLSIASVVIDGTDIVITTASYDSYYYAYVFGNLVVNCTIRELYSHTHYPVEDTSTRKGYHQQLELQQSKNEHDEYEEVSLYPQKVVQENNGTELMHPEGTDGLIVQPFSAKYPQKIQLEVMFQNLVHFSDSGSQESDTVELCVGYSLDGGVTYLPFNAFQQSSGIISVTDVGVYTDAQGTYRVTRFSGHKNKAMRFIAEKTFTFDEVFNIPDGEIKVKNNVIEFKVWRKSVDYSVTDSKHQYKCSLNAIRTWCYDYKKTLQNYLDDETEELVPQRPIIEKYRDMTARLGFCIRAGEEISGTLNELNVVMESRARYCTITEENGEKVYTWSNDTKPTNNPASLALMILQHPMRGDYVYSDEELDMESFGKFYEWCEQTDFGFINSDGRKYTANGVMSRQTKTIDLVNQILNCGHGKLVINGNKYGIQFDKPDNLPVMVLNNQNVLEAKNTKNFDEEIDGFSCKFVDCINDYQEDTQIFVPKDLTDPTSPHYKDPSEYKLESIELPWITDAKRAYRMCMYMLACRKLRPETWERKLGVDGNLLDVGSLVTVQDDTIVVGIGDGAQIEDVITEEGDIISIVCDFGFDVQDLTKTYGVTIQHSDLTHGVSVRTYQLASFASVGTKKTLVFETPIDSATVIKPAVGDIVSFGIYEKVTTDAICLSKKSNNDGTFTLTLVPYQDNIYEAEYGTIPEFVTNVSVLKDSTAVPVKAEEIYPTYEQVKTIAIANASELRVLDNLYEEGTDGEVALYHGAFFRYSESERVWHRLDNTAYLGAFYLAPQNPAINSFYLSLAETELDTLLELHNDENLELTDGTLLELFTRSRIGSIYVFTESGWREVPNRNDYRYIIAFNDLYQHGFELPTNYTTYVEEASKQSVSENTPKYLGALTTEPSGNENLGDWFTWAGETTATREQGKVYRLERNGSSYAWVKLNENDTANAKELMTALQDILMLNKSGVGYFSTMFANALIANDAFIEKLSASTINFINHVSSSIKENPQTGDLCISMGKNPNNATDSDYNFIVSSYKGKLDNTTPIWMKEFFSKRNNNRIDFNITGEINSDYGMSTFNNMYVGAEIRKKELTGDGINVLQTQIVSAYINGAYYNIVTSQSGLAVYKSTDGEAFSLYKDFGSFTGGVSDAIVYKGYIYFTVCKDSVYRLFSFYRYDDVNNEITKIGDVGAYNLRIVQDCIILANDEVYKYDGTTLTYIPTARGYCCCQFSDDLFTLCERWDEIDTGAGAGSQTELYFYDKNFNLIGVKDTSGRTIRLLDGTSSYINLAGCIYSAKGILYGFFLTNNTRYVFAVSYDAGNSWEQKAFLQAIGIRFYQNKNLIIIRSGINCLYSVDNGTTFNLIDTTYVRNCWILPSGCFEVNDDDRYRTIVVPDAYNMLPIFGDCDLIFRKIYQFNVSKCLSSIIDNQ